MGFGVLLVIYSLGGHISAYRGWLGAEGERETGKQIERLGSEWHCEHDLEHRHGNYDHVLVSASGHVLARLEAVTQHSRGRGRHAPLRTPCIRGERISRGSEDCECGAATTARVSGTVGYKRVVVVWGDFPQQRHEEEQVVYVQGERLLEWLTSLAAKVNAPQRAAYVTALRQVRESLNSAVAN
jgi:hypothetical protein